MRVGLFFIPGIKSKLRSPEFSEIPRANIFFLSASSIFSAGEITKFVSVVFMVRVVDNNNIVSRLITGPRNFLRNPETLPPPLLAS
jgi:hypothetical protein